MADFICRMTLTVVLHVCKMEGKGMFEIGELIIYGGNGVCRVEKIGPVDTGMGKNDRMYYTLNPLKNRDSKIYTPVDNEKVIMRPTMTREDALKLIDQIQDVETLWVGDERRREAEYKEAVRKCDCREYVKIIKTIYLRKKKRMADGKKVTAVDERYFAMAEDNLYGELAVALDMDKVQAKAFVEQRVKEMSVQ